MPTVEVRVRNKKGEQKGFRRAGLKFGPEWEPYDLTAEQLKAVKAEPMLEVRAVQKQTITAEELKEKIKAANSIEELEGIVPKDEERKTVLDAAAAKRKELVSE